MVRDKQCKCAGIVFLFHGAPDPARASSARLRSAFVRSVHAGGEDATAWEVLREEDCKPQPSSGVPTALKVPGVP